jgi:ABC-type Zn uptake system ZnuABC Zn-binding protein ZnuA
MKKTIISVLSFLSISTSYANVNVVVSVIPQQTFVEKIGGDKVNVTTMVKPGSDPHSYEPKPSQMKAISKADIYFPIKIEFENAWLEKFQEQNKNMKMIPMTKNITYIDMPEHGNIDDEEHTEELPFEWAGAFNLKKGEYAWSFNKVSGKYADPKMKFLMIQATNSKNDIIENNEQIAKKLFNSKTFQANNGDTISKNKKTFELHFDENKNQTVFKLSIKEDGNYIFFTEHFPFEFEDKEHFLKDMARNDIEPIATHPESDGHAHHHHHGDGKDPHTWVSPSSVKIMAKNILNALINEDSKNKDYYTNNYNNFIKEIDTTDIKIKKILSSIPTNSKFMVFHPSWGYFAQDYGLIQLAIEVNGKEPKPKMLKKIINKAKTEEVKAIFAQEEFSDKSARTIANSLGIKVIKETPLAKNWSENLIKMANAIANNN